MRACARFSLALVLALLVAGCTASDAAEQAAAPATESTAAPASEPAAAEAATETPADEVLFTGTIDGRAWSATGVGAWLGWFPNGMPGSGSTTPLLQMGFHSTVPDDGRRLTVWINDYAMTVGVVPHEHLEIILHGPHPDGDGTYGFNAETGDDFELEILSWEALDAASYRVSGTLRGTLKLVFDTPTVVIENGRFENVEIPVR